MWHADHHADPEPERPAGDPPVGRERRRDVLEELPGLTPGQAVIAGDAMNTPVLTRIRERHGAESLDATSEWRDSWESWHAERNRGVVDPYESDEEVDEAPL